MGMKAILLRDIHLYGHTESHKGETVEVLRADEEGWTTVYSNLHDWEFEVSEDDLEFEDI